MENFKKNNEDISKIIIFKLYEMGKTQKWLSNQCGVTQATISSVICQKRNPSKKLLCGISQNINVPYEVLEKAVQDSKKGKEYGNMVINP